MPLEELSDTQQITDHTSVMMCRVPEVYHQIQSDLSVFTFHPQYDLSVLALSPSAPCADRQAVRERYFGFMDGRAPENILDQSLSVDKPDPVMPSLVCLLTQQEITRCVPMIPSCTSRPCRDDWVR
jgi:hypothetical protein